MANEPGFLSPYRYIWAWIRHSDIISVGKLVLTMGAQASRWAPDDEPPRPTADSRAYFSGARFNRMGRVDWLRIQTTRSVPSSLGTRPNLKSFPHGLTCPFILRTG